MESITVVFNDGSCAYSRRDLLFEFGLVRNVLDVCLGATTIKIPFDRKSFDQVREEVANAVLNSEYVIPPAWDSILGFMLFDREWITIEGAIRANDLERMKHIMRCGAHLRSEMVAVAAACGRIECLRYLCEHTCPYDANACLRAVKCNQLECLKYLCEIGAMERCASECECADRIGEAKCTRPHHAFCAAAHDGRLACLQYLLLHEKWREFSDDVMLAAIEGNQVESLQWMCEHDVAIPNWACEEAADHGSLDCLKYLRARHCPWSSDVCMFAARKGFLHILRWAHANGCPWNIQAMHNAAGFGRIECVRWLHEQGMEWDAHTLIVAVAEGFAECAEYMCAEGCPLDWAATCFATRHGARCLEILRAHGCPWDARVLSCAAFNGNLPCLQWARAHGCEWSAPVESSTLTDEDIHAYCELAYVEIHPNAIDVCASAALMGHLEILQWARANGCWWNTRTCAMAAAGGHLEVLQWAHEHGAPWGAICCSLAARYSLACLRYACENGCPVPSGILRIAEEWSRKDCAAYLREHGYA